MEHVIMEIEKIFDLLHAEIESGKNPMLNIDVNDLEVVNMVTIRNVLEGMNIEWYKLIDDMESWTLWNKYRSRLQMWESFLLSHYVDYGAFIGILDFEVITDMEATINNKAQLDRIKGLDTHPKIKIHILNRENGKSEYNTYFIEKQQFIYKGDYVKANFIYPESDADKIKLLLETLGEEMVGFLPEDNRIEFLDEMSDFVIYAIDGDPLQVLDPYKLDRPMTAEERVMFFAVYFDFRLAEIANLIGRYRHLMTEKQVSFIDVILERLSEYYKIMNN